MRYKMNREKLKQTIIDTIDLAVEIGNEKGLTSEQKITLAKILLPEVLRHQSVGDVTVG
tara:strand:+ start:469 stop:645 length:177 start_codon:yes stop_codon:yes gene_type:complete